MKNMQLSLSALRVNNDMTQQDVADKLGITREWVGKLENGQEVKPLYIYAFAKLYGVEVDNIRVPC